MRQKIPVMTLFSLLISTSVSSETYLCASGGHDNGAPFELVRKAGQFINPINRHGGMTNAYKIVGESERYLVLAQAGIYPRGATISLIVIDNDAPFGSHNMVSIMGAPFLEGDNLPASVEIPQINDEWDKGRCSVKR